MQGAGSCVHSYVGVCVCVVDVQGAGSGVCVGGDTIENAMYSKTYSETQHTNKDIIETALCELDIAYCPS